MRRLSYIDTSHWLSNVESQTSNSRGEDLPKDQPREIFRNIFIFSVGLVKVLPPWTKN